MYTFLNIVYGVPLTNELVKEMKKLDIYDEEEIGVIAGFETLYHGGADDVGYCGVMLGDTDEFRGPFTLTDVKNIAERLTSLQRIQAQEKIDALDPRLKHLLLPVDLYFIESSS